MNAQDQITLDLSRVTILSQLLSSSVLTDNRQQVLNTYKLMLSEMSKVGYQLAQVYNFEAMGV